MQFLTPCIRLMSFALFLGYSLGIGCGTASAGVWKDLTVNAESDWAGCGSGGYLPIRVSLANRGVARTVTLSYRGIDSSTVSRSVEIGSPGGSPQAIKMQLTLLVPCTTQSSWGSLFVSVDGREIPELSVTGISIPDARNYQELGPAVLVASNLPVNLANLTKAIQQLLSPGSGSYYPTVADDQAYVSSSTLPSEWQAYTGLDILVIDEPSLLGVTPDVRTAIMKWVETGGNLVVTEIPSKQAALDPEAPEIKKLETLLGFQRTSEVQTWRQFPEIASYGSIRSKIADSLYAELQQNSLAITDPPPSLNGQTVEEFLREAFDYSLKSRSKLGLVRNRQRGQVYAIRWDLFETLPGDAEPASHAPWMLLIDSMGKGRWDWKTRQGFSARHGNDTFMNFPIPSVQGVPIAAFLVLITLFSIVIGPVNYFYLLRQKRLYLLVLTIPAIAIITSLSLFAYSAVAHGFRTRSRVRSVTVIDQAANRAMVTSRIALYSGLAPGGGLNFSKDSAVYPIWASSDDSNVGEVNWTDVQNFGSGWLRSRTRTQFFVTTQRDERGRLEITKEGDKLVVANGFEFDLELLTVSDANGTRYFTESLAAGGTARLTEMTLENRQRVTTRLSEFPLAPPPGRRGYSSGYDYDSYGYDNEYNTPASDYDSSLQEREWADLSRTEYNSKTRPREYTAFAVTNPGIDLGIKSTYEESSSHLIRGHY